MPKYLLLKHYRGGPEPHRAVPPIDRWAPEDVEAHVAFQHHVSELLEEHGEYVAAHALTGELILLLLPVVFEKACDLTHRLPL